MRNDQKAWEITEKAIESYDVSRPKQSVAAAMAAYNAYYIHGRSSRSRVAEATSAERRMRYYLGNALAGWNQEITSTPVAEEDVMEFMAPYRYAERIRVSLVDYINRDNAKRNPLPKGGGRQ